MFPFFFVVLALINCFGTLGFTLGNVLVNNAVPESQLAMINGISQSLSALARGLAPIIGGVVMTVASEMHFPGRQFVVFALMGAITFVCGWVVKAVPERQAGASPG